MKKLNNEEFINRCINIHGNKYDYTSVYYINSKEKVLIKCIKHNYTFSITPNHHLKGVGCSKCSGNYKKTTNDFIKESIEIHGDTYDYSLVEYRGANQKVDIICPIHGIFKQRPASHLLPHGCKKCNTANIDSNYDNYKDYFIDKCNKIHNNKYDYNNLKFNKNDEIILYCKKHGEFNIHINKHLKGKGCKLCEDVKKKSELNNRRNLFFKKCNKVHGNIFTYIKESYKNINSNITIICPEHGEFKQKAHNHSLGYGCSKCSNNFKKTQDMFIEQANKIHNNKYDYTKIEYVNQNSNITIICPEHGEFKMKALSHLNYGICQNCRSTKSKGEMIIENYLNKNNIEFKYQYKFNDCKNKLPLPFDFFIPKKNICIEYDGIQHFKPIKRFGGVKSFNKTKINDNIKNNYCEEKNIKLIRIKYDENIYDILDEYFNLNTQKDDNIFSPYQKTINELNSFMSDKDEYKWSEVIKNIEHHYKSDNNANSTLRNFIKRGIINNYFLIKRDNRLFLKKVNQ